MLHKCSWLFLNISSANKISPGLCKNLFVLALTQFLASLFFSLLILLGAENGQDEICTQKLTARFIGIQNNIFVFFYLLKKCTGSPRAVWLYFPHVFVYQRSVRERESCLVVIALGYYNCCRSLTSPESEVDTAYRDQGNGNLTPVRKLLDKLIRSQLKKIQQQIEFSQWITTANVWSLKWQE